MATDLDFIDGLLETLPEATTTSTPTIRRTKPAQNKVDPQEIYNYLVSKDNVTKEHAEGMLANMDAESAFYSDIVQPGVANPGLGLFQYTEPTRKKNFLKAAPNWKSDWKSQIDFALTEGLTNDYLNKRFRNSRQASEWFTKNWERPANMHHEAKKRSGKLGSLTKTIDSSGSESTDDILNDIFAVKEEPIIEESTDDILGDIFNETQKPTTDSIKPVVESIPEPVLDTEDTQIAQINEADTKPIEEPKSPEEISSFFDQFSQQDIRDTKSIIEKSDRSDKIDTEIKDLDIVDRLIGGLNTAVPIVSETVEEQTKLGQKTELESEKRTLRKETSQLERGIKERLRTKTGSKLAQQTASLEKEVEDIKSKLPTKTLSMDPSKPLIPERTEEELQEIAEMRAKMRELEASKLEEWVNNGGEDGRIGVTLQGLAKGANIVGMNLVGTPLEAGGNLIGFEWMEKLGKKIYEAGKNAPSMRAGRPADIDVDVIDDPSVMLKPSWWLYNTTQMGPALAATIGPAGIGSAAGAFLNMPKLATAGGMLFGGATGGMMEGSGTYQQMKESGYSEAEARLGGLYMTLGSGALNAISINRFLSVLPKTFKGKAVHRMIAGSTEAVTEWMEEPTSVVSEALSSEKLETGKEIMDDIKKNLRTGVDVLGPSFITGFFTAGAIPLNKEEETLLDKKHDALLVELKKRVENGDSLKDASEGMAKDGTQKTLLDAKNEGTLLEAVADLTSDKFSEAAVEQKESRETVENLKSTEEAGVQEIKAGEPLPAGFEQVPGTEKETKDGEDKIRIRAEEDELIKRGETEELVKLQRANYEDAREALKNTDVLDRREDQLNSDERELRNDYHNKRDKLIETENKIYKSADREGKIESLKMTQARLENELRKKIPSIEGKGNQKISDEDQFSYNQLQQTKNRITLLTLENEIEGVGREPIERVVKKGADVYQFGKGKAIPLTFADIEKAEGMVKFGGNPELKNERLGIPSWVNQADGSINMDKKAFNDLWDTKGWTESKVEGVKGLPKKIFKTVKELAEFVINHENTHIEFRGLNTFKEGTPEHAKRKAEVENFTNHVALIRMGKGEQAREIYGELPEALQIEQRAQEWAALEDYELLKSNFNKEVSDGKKTTAEKGKEKTEEIKEETKPDKPSVKKTPDKTNTGLDELDKINNLKKLREKNKRTNTAEEVWENVKDFKDGTIIYDNNDPDIRIKIEHKTSKRGHETVAFITEVIDDNGNWSTSSYEEVTRKKDGSFNPNVDLPSMFLARPEENLDLRIEEVDTSLDAPVAVDTEAVKDEIPVESPALGEKLSEDEQLHIDGLKKFISDDTYGGLPQKQEGKLYHGTQNKNIEVSYSGDLVLKPSDNFSGKQNGVSLTQLKDAAKFYGEHRGGKTRKVSSGTIIIEIDQKDLPKTSKQSIEEQFINTKENIIVPKGDFTIHKSDEDISRKSSPDEETLEEFENKIKKEISKNDNNSLINNVLIQFSQTEIDENNRAFEDPFGNVESGLSIELVEKYGPSPIENLEGIFSSEEVVKRVKKDGIEKFAESLDNENRINSPYGAMTIREFFDEFIKKVVKKVVKKPVAKKVVKKKSSSVILTESAKKLFAKESQKSRSIPDKETARKLNEFVKKDPAYKKKSRILEALRKKVPELNKQIVEADKNFETKQKVRLMARKKVLEGQITSTQLSLLRTEFQIIRNKISDVNKLLGKEIEQFKPIHVRKAQESAENFKIELGGELEEALPKELDYISKPKFQILSEEELDWMGKWIKNSQELRTLKERKDAGVATATDLKQIKELLKKSADLRQEAQDLEVQNKSIFFDSLLDSFSKTEFDDDLSSAQQISDDLLASDNKDETLSSQLSKVNKDLETNPSQELRDKKQDLLDEMKFEAGDIQESVAEYTKRIELQAEKAIAKEIKDNESNVTGDPKLDAERSVIDRMKTRRAKATDKNMIKAYDDVIENFEQIVARKLGNLPLDPEILSDKAVQKKLKLERENEILEGDLLKAKSPALKAKIRKIIDSNNKKLTDVIPDESWKAVQEGLQDDFPFGKKKKPKVDFEPSFIMKYLDDFWTNTKQVFRSKKAVREMLGIQWKRLVGIHDELKITNQLFVQTLVEDTTPLERAVLPFYIQGLESEHDTVLAINTAIGQMKQNMRKAEDKNKAKWLKNIVELEDVKIEMMDMLHDPVQRKKLNKSVKSIKKHNDAIADLIRENYHNLSFEQQKYYVAQLWGTPIDTKDISDIDVKNFEASFIKKKKMENLLEGLVKGYTPRFWDLAENIHFNTQMILQTNFNNQVLNMLKGNNKTKKALLMTAEKAKNIDGYVPVKIDQKALEGMYIHKSALPVLNAAFQTRYNNWFLRQLWEPLNAIGKRLNLSYSLFHPWSLVETGIGTIRLGFDKKSANSILRFAKKNTNAVAMWKAVKNGSYDVLLENWDVASDFVRHNGQLGDIIDVHRDLLDNFYKNIAEKLDEVVPHGGAAFHGVRSVNKALDRWLWDYIHNNLKLDGYSDTRDINLAAKKKKLGRELTNEEIESVKFETAQFVNDTFGGQNWLAMMTNPRNLQITQALMLSPDWTVSTFKQFLSTFGMFSVGLSTSERLLRAKMGAKFWAKSIGIYWSGLQLFNALFRGADDEEEWETQIDEFQQSLVDAQKDLSNTNNPLTKKRMEKKVIDIKAKMRNNPKPKTLSEAVSTGDMTRMIDLSMYGNDPGRRFSMYYGGGRYFSFGKQHKDFPELLVSFKNPENPDFLPEVGVDKAFKQFFHKAGGKAGPNLNALSLLFTGHTLGGYQPKRIRDAKKKGVGVFGAHMISAAGQYLPFMASRLVDDQKEFGFNEAIDAFKLAQKGKGTEAATKALRAGTTIALNTAVQAQIGPSEFALKKAVDASYKEYTMARQIYDEKVSDGSIKKSDRKKFASKTKEYNKRMTFIRRAALRNGINPITIGSNVYGKALNAIDPAIDKVESEKRYYEGKKALNLAETKYFAKLKARDAELKYYKANLGIASEISKEMGENAYNRHKTMKLGGD